MVNGQTKAKAFDTFLQRNAFYLFLTKRLPKCRMFGNIRIKRKTNVIFYILRQTGERFAIFQTKKSNIVTFLWRNTYRFRHLSIDFVPKWNDKIKNSELTLQYFLLSLIRHVPVFIVWSECLYRMFVPYFCIVCLHHLSIPYPWIVYFDWPSLFVISKLKKVKQWRDGTNRGAIVLAW